MIAPTRLATPEPSFRELFTPKLVTVFREGYDLGKLRADALAGLTVAIVALPLSMAIAVASGTSPERGLYTAIVGGFLISALGGSRFQIGGPAGAFIVLVAATIERHGYRRLSPRDDDRGRRASRPRLPAAWDLHQVHPASGHRRVHGRHRRHHPGEPAARPLRPRACRQGAGRLPAEARQLCGAPRRPSTRPPPRSPQARSEPSCSRAATARPGPAS